MTLPSGDAEMATDQTDSETNTYCSDDGALDDRCQCPPHWWRRRALMRGRGLSHSPSATPHRPSPARHRRCHHRTLPSTAVRQLSYLAMAVASASEAPAFLTSAQRLASIRSRDWSTLPPKSRHWWLALEYPFGGHRRHYTLGL